MCFLHQKYISQLTIIVIEVLVCIYFFIFDYFRLLLWTVFCCCCFVYIDRNTVQVTDECF